MKNIINNKLSASIKQCLLKIYHKVMLLKLQYVDNKRYRIYSYSGKKDYTFEQIVAMMTRTYHSIEKGLSYENVRQGFGQKQLEKLIELLDIYIKNDYPINHISYLSAIDNLNKYVKYHEEHNYDVSNLKKYISKYSIPPDTDLGGIYELKKSDVSSDKMNFLDFSKSRHSVRTFSKEPVNVELINKAIKLAQYSPSSCNRQPWVTRIVKSDNFKEKVRSNQYGNRGFGEQVDSFVIITSNVECYNTATDRNQSYIDGGIYAMNLLYSLHYQGLATCPLSTALTSRQEENIRNNFNISSSENLILIIAIGNYADKYKVPKSTRYEPKIINY